MTRSATWRASSGSSVSSSRMANSSPPNRAAVSPVRSDLHQAIRHGDQELVTGGVAQTVIDQFEVVEVEEQYGQRGHGPGGASRACSRPVPEQGTVGQPAQGVVESLVLQLLFQTLCAR